MKLLREYIKVMMLEGTGAEFAKSIVDRYGIKLSLGDPSFGNNDEPDIAELHSIVVPKEKRGEGIATTVMNEVTSWADSHGHILVLDPSPDFGSSVSRLKKFYSRFGFVANKGRKKDYRSRATMIRYPKENS